MTKKSSYFCHCAQNNEVKKKKKKHKLNTFFNMIKLVEGGKKINSFDSLELEIKYCNIIITNDD